MNLYIGVVIGFIIGFCLGLASPYIVDVGISGAMPVIELDRQHAMTPCSSWQSTIGPNDDPHKYDHNPSVETCRGNIAGPDYYRKAIEGCCKYKYGDVIP